MGKPSTEPSSTITHFSHPHPLHLLNPQTLLPQSFHCSACKLHATYAAIYACTDCNFALHPRCSDLPQQINHPFDQKHALTLYPMPVYPEGLFNCDACAHRGAGFSYHCTPCGIDLHTTCASLPVTLTHHCHHHPLTLTFSAPYQDSTFSCDFCKKLGSKWLYRCATCEFDVHSTCVGTIIPPAQPHVSPRSIGGQVVANPYPAGVPQQYHVNVNQQVYRPAMG